MISRRAFLAGLAALAAAPPRLGSWAAGPTGRIEAVAIWKRCLTDAEIGALRTILFQYAPLAGAPDRRLAVGVGERGPVGPAVEVRELSWPRNFAWPGGEIPALSSRPGAVDVVTAVFDGARWCGVVSRDLLA